MTSLEKWRALSRAWSVRIAAIGAALYAAVLALDPVQLQDVWQSLPPELRAMLPEHVQTWIGLILMAAVIVARGVPQPAVDRRLSLLAAPGWQAAARAPITRRITSIAIHCSATPAGRDVRASTIRAWHKAKGWTDIGYHFVVELDGTIEVGRPLAQAGAHVQGYNNNSVGICYVGGLAADGKTSADTRTPAQKAALLSLIRELKEHFPGAIVKGHRDYSPDTNGNGRVDRNEWLKDCPCFDAQAEYAELRA